MNVLLVFYFKNPKRGPWTYGQDKVVSISKDYVSALVLPGGNGGRAFALSCLLVFLTPCSIESPETHLHTYLVPMGSTGRHHRKYALSFNFVELQVISARLYRYTVIPRLRPSTAGCSPPHHVSSRLAVRHLCPK